MMIGAEQVKKDYQSMIGRKVRSRYFALRGLEDFNPGDVWYAEEIVVPELGIEEEDGVIVRLEGRIKGTIALDRGREITEQEADRMEALDDDLQLTRYHVHDQVVVSIIETDGPAQRAELLETYQQQKRRLRDEERAKNDRLATVMESLMTMLANEKGLDLKSILPPYQAQPDIPMTAGQKEAVAIMQEPGPDIQTEDEPDNEDAPRGRGRPPKARA